MTLVSFPQTTYSIQTRGRYGRSAGYGLARRGDSLYGLQDYSGGIFQAKKTRNGKQISRMRVYRPTNPQTVAQQAWRAVFTDGRAQWAALTDLQKSAYNQRARGSRMTGFNLFMREYLYSHRL